jgi:hypothetical protein
MTPKFHAKIIGGRIKLSRGEGRLWRDYLLSLEGEPVQVTVSKVKGLRTEQQMRYYFGVVVKLIAEHTGHDTDYIHEFLKDKFAPRKSLWVNGEVRIVAGCTHDLWKENFFEDYVEKIRQWAAEKLEISIPDPQQVSV